MSIRPFLVALSTSCALTAAVQAGESLGVPGPARSCSRHGPGFVEIPGTSTCIRIGGRVRSEYGTAVRQVLRDDMAAFRSSGAVSVDSRTDTAYGPLRSYVRLRAGRDAGRP